MGEAISTNLGPDLLSDPAYCDKSADGLFFGKHPEFQEEIATRMNSDRRELGMESDADGDEEVMDDSKVPLAIVINKSLGVDVIIESDSDIWGLSQMLLLFCRIVCVL